MLIQFKVSNFLSFDGEQIFAMNAGKARKYSDRLYHHKNFKLDKCKVVLGANASGKSNLVYALEFMKRMIVKGLPNGFSSKFHRLKPGNKNNPSKFEITILCDDKIITYGFTILLSNGSIIDEYLYENSGSDVHKVLFQRNTINETFLIGSYFKNETSISKLNNYGEDSVSDQEILFLTLINKNKNKMYEDFPELEIFRKIFNWFAVKFNISFPDCILTGYPYFTNSNLQEIADLLNALGTGISELKIVEVPENIIKGKIPKDLYDKIVADLEKENAKKRNNIEDCPKIMVRSYKEFYTFEINTDNRIVITTIEFSHEKKDIYFDLNEESDGTARLLDLIEILFRISDDKVFVIDEIDRCLHPSMTVKILELFLKMATYRNTQLIITSHESRILAEDILRNDEVCFAIKNTAGATELNPLEKYQLRADKRVYAALFDGTLNALPDFNEKKLDSIVTKQ